jgi:hypothetical protein
VVFSRVEIDIILCHAIAIVGEAFSKLVFFLRFWSIFLHDLLRVTSDGFRS